jgi:hypothetical protein
MKVLLLIITTIFMSVSSGMAQNADEKAVAQAVEKFRKTMVDPDQATFEKLTSSALTYGHSSGLIEDKKTCIESMVSGKYNFESIELSEQTITIVEKTAIVRHTLFAHTHDAGKDAGTVRLKVLTVWQKQNGNWLLLARQAVKLL